MKKRIVLLILSGLFPASILHAQINIPQLQAGVYINDTIQSFTYSFAGYCGTLPTHDVNLAMDNGLIPFVSGVELFYVVSQLTTPPGSVMSSQGGILNIGDTLHFSSSPNNQYTFYASTTGTMTLEMIISGTPTLPFQNYPCDIATFCTLADCNNSCLTISNAPGTCVVDNFSATHSFSNETSFTITPNPSTTFIQIHHLINSDCYFEIEVFDISGRTVLTETIYQQNEATILPITHFVNGIYFWKISGCDPFIQTGKIFVNK